MPDNPGHPIAYTALQPGTPVQTSDGQQFATVQVVLVDELVSVFDGIVVLTAEGTRFVDADQVGAIYTTHVRTTLSGEQAAALPAARAVESGGDQACSVGRRSAAPDVRSGEALVPTAVWHDRGMRCWIALGLLSALVSCVLGCGADEAVVSADPGDPVATVGDVRFSLPTNHKVVVERRTAEGWGDARVVFEDRGRECGTVHAIAAGSTVAATVDCDEAYAVDQMPTESVALISADGDSWTHRDLDGEASGTPGLSPQGDHAVWVQGDDLLTWGAGSFDTAPRPVGSPQVVTVDDSGTILGLGVGTSAGSCTVTVRASDATDPQPAVPVASRDKLSCGEIGLALETPVEIHGDVSGQAGTEFVVRRGASGEWTLTARPPLAAPGLDVYSDDRDDAVWNQVTSNTRGDLVAVGSPDRQRVTAQRYDRVRQRWTPSRVVYVADVPTCRRSNGDSGVLQGATFRLRLICDGKPIVLRSRAGASWST